MTSKEILNAIGWLNVKRADPGLIYAQKEVIRKEIEALEKKYQ